MPVRPIRNSSALVRLLAKALPRHVVTELGDGPVGRAAEPSEGRGGSRCGQRRLAQRLLPVGVVGLALLLLALFTVLPLPVQAAPPPIGEAASEEDVKAALLTKLPIPMFVEWPGKQDPNSPVVIGVVGDNRLIRSLENILQSRSGGRPMTVRAIRAVAEVEGCQMLFVSRSQKKAAEYLAVAKRGVLTIGDAEGFAKNGGMIGFFVADSNINFEVNLGAANQAGITLGSRLLKLAKAVIQ